MVVLRLELHSAITGEITELGRMHISNVGGTETSGDYEVRILRAGSVDHNRILRLGYVSGFRRKTLPVWILIARAVKACYGSLV